MNVEFQRAEVPESERLAVAGFMESRSSFQEWFGRVVAEDFVGLSCKSAFETMAYLEQEGLDWTGISVLSRMATTDQGAVIWFAGLPTPPTRTELVCACEDICSAAAMRRVQTVGLAMLKTWGAGNQKPDKALGIALGIMSELQEWVDPVGPEKVVDVALRVAKAGVGSEVGIPTGWPTFDQRTGGLFPGRLYVVGARPSCGKTACAVTWGLSAARFGAKVVLLTTETSREVMASRTLGATSGEDAFKIRTGKANPSMLVDGLRAIPESLLVEDAAMSVGQIRAMIAGIRRKTSGPVVVFVDYLELVKPDKPNPKNREQEVAGIVQALHWEAKRQKVVMVVMSQLSRKADEVRGKATAGPSMSDLRQSGFIEQAADLIALLYRTGDEGGDVLDVKCRVAKNKVSGAEFGLDLTLVKGTSVLGESVAASQMKWQL